MKHWIGKFGNALRGLRSGAAGQSSFAVHIPTAVMVLVLAWLLRCQVWQWCVLGLCIAMVLSLELMNSAVENLARGLCGEHNEQVGKALDIAGASVLVASIAAALIGTAIFGQQAFALYVN